MCVGGECRPSSGQTVFSARKRLGQGNVFTCMCHSVLGVGGGGVALCMMSLSV